MAEHHHISDVVTLLFHAVSVDCLILQVCNYGLKRLEPDYPQGPSEEQRGLQRPGQGAPVCVHQRRSRLPHMDLIVRGQITVDKLEPSFERP
ncbi:unnamed protein product [Knipowitschia caucasica]|uniref:Uncharacterized protein n=1 Tax=Knipowitschia caucasica TaxID=637954 RepID=A0AAV2JPU5_KNICA